MEGMRTRWGCWCQLALVVGVWLLLTQQALGIRFVIDKKECFQHEVPNDGDQVLVSYVVIKSESAWTFDHASVGVDLIVEAPAGYQVHSSKSKVEDKFNFIAVRRGLYKFCFYNRNYVHENVDFDVHVGHHITDIDVQLVKDEHIDPLIWQIERLEESLYSIQFEQHWLLAQTDRQEIVNDAMSKRLIYKAILEALALVGCSVVQVVLLRRLFEKKLGQSSRV
ncbi:transmembrane emp24 domain-containing protein p24beta2 [Physcomitrium patens]|uniref:GOLD domain-containing protein n=1 Tax=Physcomitrium patens TaxID=3218 RepID=A0A2K1KEZ6_PHYPA|nr:transmembrane emp24 domain-containing protein p24beta2-like [Physcomitrium patens]PNR52348.1 hypothetical protein PHYPA_008722 [Physcomitrium patens]|eukprot:XP_024377477.1 transmembrane emp24 domain-containing protein p24beta2-like [Physcomitrella patens]